MEDPRHGFVAITLADWQEFFNDRPMSQFISIGLVADEVTKQAIEQQCDERGYDAGIDYLPEPGIDCYVWHTLIDRAAKRQWVFPFASRIRGGFPRQVSTEQELTVKILKVLETHNIPVETEVECSAGRADIVTQQRDVIYEIKGHLSRVVLFQAVGQVLLYRASINPDARVGIIGYPTPETAVLKPVIESLGIRVILWKD